MKVIKWLDEYLEEVLLIVLLACMVVIMGVQIAARYCFNYSLSWSEELTQYMFVWATFLSVSYCVKKHISIKIEQFLGMLPIKGKTFLRLLRHTIVLLFCIVMLPFCVRYLQQAIDLQATSPALHLPLYFIQSAPLAGFILLTIRVLQAWVREFRYLYNGVSKESLAEADAEADENAIAGKVAIMESGLPIDTEAEDIAEAAEEAMESAKSAKSGNNAEASDPVEASGPAEASDPAEAPAKEGGDK